jgi:UDP-glucose 4-epimerase
VEDLASAHLYALRYLEAGGASDVINVGYGKGESVREVIAVVKQVSGIDFPVFEAPRRPGDPANLVAVAAKVRDKLGWRPAYDDLTKIVTDAWHWEKKLFEAK